MTKLRRLAALGVLAALAAAGLLAQESKSTPSKKPGEKDELGKPFVIYDERPHPRVPPSGWMPNNQGIQFKRDYKENPYSGKKSILIRYTPADQPEGWVGIAHNVDGRFTETRRPLNLFKVMGAKKGERIVLRLYARSSTGSRVRFEFGGGEGSSAGLAKSTKWIALKNNWQRVEIDLTNQDLSKITGKLFTWVMEEAQQDEEKETYDLHLDRIYVTKVIRKPLDEK